jgi:predicted dehydrogenase
MYRVGIIGSGLQATRRATSMQQHQNCQIDIIAGIEEEQVKMLARTCYSKLTDDWYKVVMNDDIDIVVICTPPSLHYEIASKALENGKHVLCEKPMTMSSEDARKLYHMSLSTKGKIMCGFNHRHHPAMLDGYKLIKSGELGKPLTGRAVYGICGREGCENEWRSNPNFVAGGQLMEQGIHVVDLYRWFFGEFESISADVSTQVFPINPLEDTAVALLHGANGVTATVHSSITQWRNKFRFEIYCSEGYIEIRGLGGSYDLEQLVIGKRNSNAPFKEEIIDYRGADKSWGHEWNYFIDVIEKNGTFEMGNAWDAAMTNYIVESAYKASREKMRVSLNTFEK